MFSLRVWERNSQENWKSTGWTTPQYSNWGWQWPQRSLTRRKLIQSRFLRMRIKSFAMWFLRIGEKQTIEPELETAGSPRLNIWRSSPRVNSRCLQLRLLFRTKKRVPTFRHFVIERGLETCRVSAASLLNRSRKCGKGNSHCTYSGKDAEFWASEWPVPRRFDRSHSKDV